MTPAFQLVFLAHVAALVVRRCVTEETQYRGGYVEIWPGTGIRLGVVNPRGKTSVETI